MRHLLGQILSDRYRQTKTSIQAWLVDRPYVKYFATGIVVVGFVLFAGERDVFAYYKLLSREQELRDELEVLRPAYEADSLSMEEFLRNPNNIEHIAREQYLMKLPGEEIFLVPRTPSKK